MCYSHFTYRVCKNLNVKFKVCKSVHHRTIQINHQLDATIFQFIILMFVYSSTCFGGFLTHHQELNDCSGSLWFYLRIVVTAVLCSWSGQLALPRTQHDCHHDTKVKPEAAIAVIELLMMGGKTPETCWAVKKRQDNKLENYCIWLVIYLNFIVYWHTKIHSVSITFPLHNVHWYREAPSTGPPASVKIEQTATKQKRFLDWGRGGGNDAEQVIIQRAREGVFPVQTSAMWYSGVIQVSTASMHSLIYAHP